MPSDNILHPYEFGETVFMDGKGELSAKVTGFTYRCGCEVEIECSYWLDGVHHHVWLPLWRLKKG